MRTQAAGSRPARETEPPPTVRPGCGDPRQAAMPRPLSARPGRPRSRPSTGIHAGELAPIAMTIAPPDRRICARTGRRDRTGKTIERSGRAPGNGPGACSLPVLRQRAPRHACKMPAVRHPRHACTMPVSRLEAPNPPGKGRRRPPERTGSISPLTPRGALLWAGVGSNPDLQRTPAPQIPRGFLDRGRAE